MGEFFRYILLDLKINIVNQEECRNFEIEGVWNLSGNKCSIFKLKFIRTKLS